MKYTYTEKKDTRSGFGDGLLEAAKKNENVVALCADLTGSLKMDGFEKEFPERFFQVGIAEANMIGIAAGLATGGKIQTSQQVEFMIKFVSRLRIQTKMLKSPLHTQV